MAPPFNVLFVVNCIKCRTISKVRLGLQKHDVSRLLQWDRLHHVSCGLLIDRHAVIDIYQ